MADFARKYEKGQVDKKGQEDLIRRLTIKREKKLETITHRRKERERTKTTELIDKQAEEMLNLFRQARLERVNGYYPVKFFDFIRKNNSHFRIITSLKQVRAIHRLIRPLHHLPCHHLAASGTYTPTRRCSTRSTKLPSV